LEFNVPFQHKYGYIRDEDKYVKKMLWTVEKWRKLIKDVV